MNVMSPQLIFLQDPQLTENYYFLTSSSFFGFPVTKVSTGLPELDVSRLLELAAAVLIIALKDHVYTLPNIEETGGGAT